MKPILFNNEMVRAILDGNKTQTRRTMKGIDPRDNFLGIEDGATLCYTDKHGEEVPKDVPGMWAAFEANEEYRDVDFPMVKLPHEPGDILWVRETCTRVEDGWWYKTDGVPNEPWGKLYDTKSWIPSIHMPCEAARLFLRVKDVRVERVQDISENDCLPARISWLHK